MDVQIKGQTACVTAGVPRNNSIREKSRQCLTVKYQEKSRQARSQKNEGGVESLRGEAMDSANDTTRPQ
jgi:hypothetical protein